MGNARSRIQLAVGESQDPRRVPPPMCRPLLSQTICSMMSSGSRATDQIARNQLDYLLRSPKQKRAERIDANQLTGRRGMSILHGDLLAEVGEPVCPAGERPVRIPCQHGVI